jgi:membrane-bound lytic murein transglycosylase A
MARLRPFVCGLYLIILCLSGAPTTAPAKGRGPMKIPDAQFEPLAFSALDGWAADDHAAAFVAFRKSCRAIVDGVKGRRAARPMYRALAKVCRKALAIKQPDAAAARAFFEHNFRPVRISRLGEQEGFITGYYEPVVEGSPVQTEEFRFPLYRRPSDLVAIGKRRKRAGYPDDFKIGRQVSPGKIVPHYYDRPEIEDGALAGRGLEICWLMDPIDAFFVHIQGSARVDLGNGKLLRVNYAAQNGYRYLAVGRILIDRGIVPKEEMSMQRIRQWMQANPAEGRELRRQNKSFVFFRAVKLAPGDEPEGAQGVPLTPWRSIAVDRMLHVYGTLFWIEADLPIESEKSETRFRRLMVAQDTGSSILGPARADIYFGTGDKAADIAGRLRHHGRFVMLVPQGLKLDGEGAGVPLPRPRPARAKQEPRK